MQMGQGEAGYETLRDLCFVFMKCLEAGCCDCKQPKKGAESHHPLTVSLRRQTHNPI